MTVTVSIALFFVIWWTVLFAVLPWGLRTQGEDGAVVPGTPSSAPSRPHILRLFVINTAVAAVVFAVVWSAITFGWLPIDALPSSFNPGTGPKN